jgi:hypothetical protein
VTKSAEYLDAYDSLGASIGTLTSATDPIMAVGGNYIFYTETATGDYTFE